MSEQLIVIIRYPARWTTTQLDQEQEKCEASFRQYLMFPESRSDVRRDVVAYTIGTLNGGLT